MCIYNQHHLLLWCFILTLFVSHCHGFGMATYPRHCRAWVGPPPAVASFYDDESLCYVSINRKTTWNTAKKICSEHGWSLVKVESEKVLSFIERTVKTQGGAIWIGLSDEEKEGVYRWADGSLLKHMSDKLSFSFLKYRYDCEAVIQFFFVKFTWTQLPCDYERHFVCQTNSTYVTSTPALTKADNSHTETSAKDGTNVTTTNPALTKADNRHPEPSAKDFVRVECNTKSQSEPNFSTRGRLLICSRECKQRTCAMFNFHRPTNTCNVFMSPEVLTGGTKHGEGWEVWTEMK